MAIKCVPIGELIRQVETNAQEFNFIPSIADILNYIQQLISTATNLVGSTAAIGFNVVGSIFQVVLSFLLVFFLSLYLTKDAPDIRAYFGALFPASYQHELIDVGKRIAFVWRAFFRGQLLWLYFDGRTSNSLGPNQGTRILDYFIESKTAFRVALAMTVDAMRPDGCIQICPLSDNRTGQVQENQRHKDRVECSSLHHLLFSQERNDRAQLSPL